MTTNRMLMCRRLVGLDLVAVLRVEDWLPYVPLRVHVETCLGRPPCPGCGAKAQVKDRDRVELVDLPCCGRAVRLVWHKIRWRCPNEGCLMNTWTEEAPWIALSRLMLSGWTRSSWAAVAATGLNVGRPRSWTYVEVSSSMSSKTATPQHRRCGWPTTGLAGGHRLGDAGHVGLVSKLCSTRCSRAQLRSSIPFTWSRPRTRRSARVMTS